MTKKGKAAKAAKKGKAAKEAPKPRQHRLAGMEDPEIDGLRGWIEKYQDAKDARMRAGAKEVEAKQEILALMKLHKKMYYYHNGDEIKRTVEKEGIQVRTGVERSEPTAKKKTKGGRKTKKPKNDPEAKEVDNEEIELSLDADNEKEETHDEGDQDDQDEANI
jgi:hypothetical protein